MSWLQVARNKAMSQLAFREGSVPKYGPAMLVPKYCGKWMVSLYVQLPEHFQLTII